MKACWLTTPIWINKPNWNRNPYKPNSENKTMTNSTKLPPRPPMLKNPTPFLVLLNKQADVKEQLLALLRKRNQ